MPLPDAHKRNLRLPRELAGRVKKEAAAQGISENDYLIIAARAKVDADEARRQQQAVDTPRSRRDRDAPRGLGLRLAPLSPPEPAPAAEPAAPVVIQVGGGGATPPAAGGDLITGLCAWVMSAAPFERDRCERQAKSILRAQGQSTGERAALEERLEEALRIMKQRLAPAARGQIGSLFRQ